MKLKDFLLRTLTWWNGQTWGTYFYTRRKGENVGSDEFGNTYYRAVGHMIDPSMGPERRWVIFSGEADASKVPPGWRGWLQHTYAVPPSEQSYAPREWEKGHISNLTGTAGAYRPPGSTLAAGHRAPATGDYMPWSPADWGGDRDVAEPDQHPGTHGVDLRRPQRG